VATLANSFNARSFTLTAGKAREHAFARLRRSRPSATGTTKAVAWLRSNYDKAFACTAPATIAGMSRSTLHLHFRALTAMSPLQFQSSFACMLRGQRMLAGDLDAASAAFQVGYESPSQFNRRVPAILWPAPNSRYQGRARRQSRARSLPLNAELLGCHGAACSRLPQTGLKALALIESLRTI